MEGDVWEKCDGVGLRSRTFPGCCLLLFNLQGQLHGMVQILWPDKFEFILNTLFEPNNILALSHLLRDSLQQSNKLDKPSSVILHSNPLMVA